MLRHFNPARISQHSPSRLEDIICRAPWICYSAVHYRNDGWERDLSKLLYTRCHPSFAGWRVSDSVSLTPLHVTGVSPYRGTGCAFRHCRRLLSPPVRDNTSRLGFSFPASLWSNLSRRISTRTKVPCAWLKGENGLPSPWLAFHVNGVWSLSRPLEFNGGGQDVH